MLDYLWGSSNTLPNSDESWDLSIAASETQDMNVADECWSGKVPARFSLAANEVTAFEAPPPVYLLLDRMSYLPLVTGSVSSHFYASAPARYDELWFECEGVPLKWNVPIGVLFDALGAAAKLPWEITVHFQNFPSKGLLRCRNHDTVRAHFINSFKAASVLRSGNTNPITHLNKDEQDQLWQSVVKSDYSLFRPILNLVASKTTDKGSQSFPIRILLCGFSDLHDKWHLKCIQRRCPLSTALGDSITVGDHLNKLIPSVISRPAVQCVVQGVQVSLDSPLEFLCDRMMHPDRFLYICVVDAAPRDPVIKQLQHASGHGSR